MKRWRVQVEVFCDEGSRFRDFGKCVFFLFYRPPRNKRKGACKEEPHTPEKHDDKEAEDKSDEKDDDGELPMLDKEFDDEEMGEEVELQAPAEDKFTNDLDPAEKK